MKPSILATLGFVVRLLLPHQVKRYLSRHRMLPYPAKRGQIF